MTTTAENKDLINRWAAALNARDFDAASRLVSEEFVNHAAIPEASGFSGFRRVMEKVFAAMPDQRVTPADVIAEGDRVVVRVVVEGTQTGPLPFAAAPLPPTGKYCKTEQIHIFRLANGKIAEHWGGRDDIGVLRQLGHLGALTAR